MLAGGMGNIRNEWIEKGEMLPGDALIVLGGPGMLIGLGGVLQVRRSPAQVSRASTLQASNEAIPK